MLNFKELEEINGDASFRKFYRNKKNNSIVPGGLYEISKSDEKKLDIYEDYPILYKKMYFK